MSSEEFKRKLAAIYSADVVGYSRMMGQDEEATVNTITVYREVMATLIKQHRGRIVDSPGDNVLAEFASVVDAAQCAVAVQKEFQSRNAELPEERRMQFRIGINLGDVIEEGDRIYGDGVNIAARLEALADPGGICISKTAFDHIESKLPLGYKYIGEQTVKNISKPVSAYKVLMDPRIITEIEKGDKKIPRRGPKKSLATLGIALIIIFIIFGMLNILSNLSDAPKGPGSKKEPSLAVLPFKNMSDDPEQEHFSDGITEELINALAKVEGIKVVSRTSAFSFKGKDVDLRTVGEKLEVDYVLEGSVRKSGDKIRITAQLINVDEDTHLWSETYDREMEDIFIIQDEISKAVTEKLKQKLLGPVSQILGKESDRRFDVNVIVDSTESVEEGLLACGANVEVAGSVNGGLKTYGANVVISGNNQGELNFFGANVILSGDFKGRVSGAAGNVTISGSLEGDIDVRAARVILTPDAVIKGDLAYSSASLELGEGSRVMGKVIQLDSEDGQAWIENLKKDIDKPSAPLSGFFRIYTLIAILIVGMLINFLFPKQMEEIISRIDASIWKSLWNGLVFLVVTPFLIVLTFVTLIGIPVGIITAFCYGVMIYISRVYAGLWTGRKILGFFKNSYATSFYLPFIAGILITAILFIIPFFGWLLRIFLLLLSLGAMWQFMWKSVKPANTV